VKTGRARDGVLLALCIWVLTIGALDYITGPSISMTLFYLAPVVVAGWTVGQRRAVAFALLAGVASIVDVTFGQRGLEFVWNIVSRTVILSIAAFAVARIRNDREQLLIQDAQRTRALQLLDLGLTTPARELNELVDRNDVSVSDLKAQVRRLANDMVFLARDFSAVVRLQSSTLPLTPSVFDLVELTDELRGEHSGARQIVMTGPADPLLVRGDRARTRQVLSALISERPSGDDLSLLVDRRDRQGELMISSGSYKPATGTETKQDSLGLSVELAQLLFNAQGGSVELTRNPLTRSLRISARLPLAS
jgi:hypothetical protein